MWDVCATVFLARPDLYAPPQKMQLGVVQWGFEQGWLRQTDGAANPARLPQLQQPRWLLRLCRDPARALGVTRA
jgi:hypothetical protein